MRIQTEADRFIAAAKRLRKSRGGRPLARLEGDRIVFEYPDGTRTIAGVTVTASQEGHR